MNTCREWLRRYKSFLVLLLINIVILPLAPETGLRTFSLTARNILEMLLFIPPVFVMLGLFDVWVERETIMRYMGQGSGCKGGFLAFMLGSLAAGPLYMAFPIAAMLIHKNASFLNVFLFIGAWATTKVPMLLFEAASLGLTYTLVRLAFNVCGIILIGRILDSFLTPDEREELRKKAAFMQDKPSSRKQAA